MMNLSEVQDKKGCEAVIHVSHPSARLSWMYAANFVNPVCTIGSATFVSNRALSKVERRISMLLTRWMNRALQKGFVGTLSDQMS